MTLGEKMVWAATFSRVREEAVWKDGRPVHDDMACAVNAVNSAYAAVEDMRKVLDGFKNCFGDASLVEHEKHKGHYVGNEEAALTEMLEDPS